MTDMEKNCPYCGEKIKQAAIKCPHCKSWLNQDEPVNRQDRLPKEYKKFNWGAFFLNWIWGIGNKTYITFLYIPASILSFFIPFLGLAISIWFGIQGNEWAWKNNNWKSLEDFNNTQRNWAIAGVIIRVSLALFLATFFILLIAMIVASGNLDGVYERVMAKEACVKYEAIKRDPDFSFSKIMEYQDLKEECGAEFASEIIDNLLK